MGTRFAFYTARTLQVLGGLFLLVLVGSGVLVTLSYHQRTTARSNYLTPRSAEFLLQRGHLGNATIRRAQHSYQSEQSFTGDHLDIYSVILDSVNASSFSYRETEHAPLLWQKPPLKETLLHEALVTAAQAALQGDSSFPTADNLSDEKRFLVCFPYLKVSEMRVYQVDMMAYDSIEHCLYYVSYKV